jgi:hypothetical protein
MFVPGLSWQMFGFQYEMAQKDLPAPAFPALSPTCAWHKKSQTPASKRGKHTERQARERGRRDNIMMRTWGRGRC